MTLEEARQDRTLMRRALNKVRASEEWAQLQGSVPMTEEVAQAIEELLCLTGHGQNFLLRFVLEVVHEDEAKVLQELIGDPATLEDEVLKFLRARYWDRAVEAFANERGLDPAMVQRIVDSRNNCDWLHCMHNRGGGMCAIGCTPLDERLQRQSAGEQLPECYLKS